MRTRKILAIFIALSVLLTSCGTPTAVVTNPTQESAPTNTIAAVVEPTATKSAEQPVEPTATTVSNEPEAEVPYVNHLFTTIADYEAATGKTIDNFNESPMLAEEVSSGTLPPVKDRLPKDVAVVRPRDAVGQYGGEMHLIGYNEGAGVFSEFTEYMQQNLFTTDPGFKIRYPNIAKGWKLSDDGKSLTLYLREGMKWSDGVDFTADDFAFWYEILQDTELTPEISPDFMPGDELMGFNKIDDYTVEYTFSIPYYRSVEVWTDNVPALPAHYLKPYMLKYNPDADALAQKEGYENWQQAMLAHGIGESNYNTDPFAPTLNPWVLADRGADSALWERNPYYFRVDTAGNQLPYIDSLLIIITEDINATGSLKSLAGELDWNDSGIGLADYTVLKKSEEKGSYQAVLWPRYDESFAMGFALNYTERDPVLREIFNDLRFRQALSLSIDRDRISETIFFGLTTPFNSPAGPLWTGYEEWMGSYYAEYDVDKANALLDEMGLQWDSAHQWRLRSDGKPISFIGTWCTEWLSYSQDLLDLDVQDWAKVGVKMDLKFVPEETLQTMFIANETDIGISNSDGGSEVLARSAYPIRLIPPWHWGGSSCCAMSSYSWRVWLDTKGAEGEEPPQQIKELYDLTMQWLNTPADTPEYTTLINQIIKINVENLYYFGTVSAAPRVVVISNRLNNIPREDGNFMSRNRYMPETFFITP